MKNHLRVLLVDLSKTLQHNGAGPVFIKQRNHFFIVTQLIDCDYYAYLSGEAAAIGTYTGEYMSQYSWAEVTRAEVAAMLMRFYQGAAADSTTGK